MEKSLAGSIAKSTAFRLLRKIWCATACLRGRRPTTHSRPRRNASRTFADLSQSRDSSVKSATEEMNSSKRDKHRGTNRNLKDIKKREKDIAAIDSLVSASQTRKTVPSARMREKFQLDSAVDVLSESEGFP